MPPLPTSAREIAISARDLRISGAAPVPMPRMPHDRRVPSGEVAISAREIGISGASCAGGRSLVVATVPLGSAAPDGAIWRSEVAIWLGEVVIWRIFSLVEEAEISPDRAELVEELAPHLPYKEGGARCLP